ncbi:hypothetical protein D5687_01880 [Guyparkeria sp. SCN-R1]|uniref:hypothetical protein n=1 Tax=Guyparkeria sp. SCN-R1 TaxID=2341113 RepID=UPI000F6479A6|nr:hypothetical protein [Guyparkeria sp. SCN-R1]RRQ24511.1 hypothetical protein D5687_01880 [Guyparkeria sp. SCN-R1]
MNHDASAETFDTNDEHTPTRISGKSARRAATWFNWGNIVAMIVPLPLAIFWTGLSMLVYALNKHHPNPKVGYYTQWAAYRFYGVAGTAMVVAVFAPPSLTFYLVLWVIAAVILIPWSLYDLYRIKQDTWEDSFTEPPESFEDN